MKIHTWLTSGLAARDNSKNPADYLVWFPANLDTLTDGPLVGESESVPFYLTPKTSALRGAGEGIVLLGVPLGELKGNWRFDNLGASANRKSTESIDEIAGIVGDNFAYQGDGAAVVQLRGEFPVDTASQVLYACNEHNQTHFAPTLRFFERGEDTLAVSAIRTLNIAHGASFNQLGAFITSSVDMTLQAFDYLASTFPALVTWEEPQP